MCKGNLDLVDLDQKATGYRRFLSCWVWRGAGLTYIVDPGPRSTIGYLIDELAALGVENLDFAILTHIHLDHGGGAAQVLDAFPGARLYCHPDGVKHIIDPERLWAGSKKVLGETAQMYGKPDPVSPDAIATKEDLSSRGIDVIMTPGHAVHHVSFLHDSILYAGEAIGTHQVIPSGDLYLRPATPPRFFLDQALGSFERLLAIKEEPQVTAFAHYGRADGAFRYIRAAREQLVRWVDTIRELKEESSDDLEPRLFARLMEIDPLYGQGHFDQLDEDLQIRERHFLGNTLDGILGYLGQG